MECFKAFYLQDRKSATNADMFFWSFLHTILSMVSFTALSKDFG